MLTKKLLALGVALAMGVATSGAWAQGANHRGGQRAEHHANQGGHHANRGHQNHGSSHHHGGRHHSRR